MMSLSSLTDDEGEMKDILEEAGVKGVSIHQHCLLIFHVTMGSVLTVATSFPRRSTLPPHVPNSPQKAPFMV